MCRGREGYAEYRHTGGAAIALVASTLLASFRLSHNSLVAEQLTLGLVDVLHQHSPVLELVTLGPHVQVLVQVLVDLLGSAVLLQQAAQHTHAAHPDDFAREASFASTLALTNASVTALALGLLHLVDSGTRVDGVGLADNISILDQLQKGRK